MTLPPSIECMNASEQHHHDHECECRSGNDDGCDERTIKDDKDEHHKRRAYDTDAQHPIHKDSVRGIRANTLPRALRR